MFHVKWKRPKHKSHARKSAAKYSARSITPGPTGGMAVRPPTGPTPNAVPERAPALSSKYCADAAVRVTHGIPAGPETTTMTPVMSALPPSMVSARTDWRDVQARVAAALRPAYLLAPDAQFFRPEPDTTASDLSLRAFHERCAVMLNPGASPGTLIMATAGHDDFADSEVPR